MSGMMKRRPHPKWRQCPVTEHTHPLVRQFFALLTAEGVALLDVTERAGVGRTVLTKWKNRSMPQLDTFAAALNVLGYELAIRKKRGE